MNSYEIYAVTLNSELTTLQYNSFLPYTRRAKHYSSIACQVLIDKTIEEQIRSMPIEALQCLNSATIKCKLRYYKI